ncbi:hypothetical protein H7F15_01780 [Pontibacter sp. Tf4]|uniref:hypothetical protein n=1 Tax=Pontibacter sp. Tf4 TaxID=2761620 RepID=UPI0016281246|nr:hypothetical protein [Pontibacter sp. Tf4]MBB6609755.1 hypothetical protein [Pontibacter sp. Tf4]
MACRTDHTHTTTTMKTVLLLIALLICLYLALDKVRQTRNLITHTTYPEMLVSPGQQQPGAAAMLV